MGVYSNLLTRRYLAPMDLFSLLIQAKLTIFLPEKEEELTEAKRCSMVTTLKELIAQSEEVYRETATKR